MKASVVIPVYNKAPFLKECMDSVLAQTFTDIEVIAVDDRSTDDSMEILRSYTDPRLKVIQMERNSGPGLAAQVGHDAAQGEYIIRVDADDIQHPDRIAKQIAFMDRHPSIGVSGTAMQRLNNRSLMMPPHTDQACRAAAIFIVPVLQPSMILRREVLLRNGVKYEEHWPRYGEDWLLLLRLFPHTEFANLPDILVTYREGGISSGRDTQDMHLLFRAAFKAFALPTPTTEELHLHGMIVKHFHHPPDAAAIRKFHGWLGHLKEWNDRNRIFAKKEFDGRLAAAWTELFYFLPPFGPGPVWEYLRLKGEFSFARLYYMIRTLDLRPDRSKFSRARRV